MDDRAEQNRAADERARYERDLYSWAVEQAALLRAGRIAEADVLNIAEEIDDVGKNEYYRLESALRVLLVHLLKWDHQQQRRSRSWRSSIVVQRDHVEESLQDNPGLKPRLGRAIERAYRAARVESAAEMELSEDLLPVTCPYSFDEIMERPIDWPPSD